MRFILSITVGVCIAAASSTARANARQVHPGLPYTLRPISMHRPLDTSCEIEGQPKPEDGAVEANKEQNRAKNNFCASGPPVTVTKKTFKDLEVKAETLEKATAGSAHPFTFGSHELVPEDRSAIRANGFHQTSDGAEVPKRVGRFQVARRREGRVCASDQSSCPRTSPSRLTPAKIRAIEEIATLPDHRHVPTRS